MGWTKRALISDAYGELALAGYEYDITPEEQQAALRRLDTLMATWDAQGVRLGYLLGLSPTESSLDDESGIPLFAVEAVYMALAVKLAASKGKQLLPSTTRTAKAAYDAMLSRLVRGQVQEQQRPSGMPLGAGCKTFRTGVPFVRAPNTDILQGADDGGLRFNEG